MKFSRYRLNDIIVDNYNLETRIGSSIADYSISHFNSAVGEIDEVNDQEVDDQNEVRVIIEDEGLKGMVNELQKTLHGQKKKHDVIFIDDQPYLHNMFISLCL